MLRDICRFRSSVCLNAVLLAVFSPQLMAFADAKTTQTPNVVVILVDDMGYGDAKCFNPESKIETPAINEMARQGMRFTDAHAPGPLCHMSRYGLMTGRYPFRTNVGLWSRQPLIHENQVTIASHLKSAGYHTAMVGKWHLGFAENGYENPLPGGPVDVGFDEFFGIRASTDIPPYFYIRHDRAVDPPSEAIAANQSEGWSPIQGEFWRAGGISPGLALKDVLPRFTDEAIRVIDQHNEKHDQPGENDPLFLYVAFPAPHTPWLPADEFKNASGAGMYGDFLMMVDSMVGRIIDRLEDTGMADDTLLVFTSDNGPVWYDGDVEKFDHDSCGPLRGMKGDAWEAGHRMPMIVRWPKVVPANSQTDQMVCFTDFLATFADVVKRPTSGSAHLDSISFLPALRDPASESEKLRRQMVISSGGGALSVRDGDWKWINRLGSSGFSQPKKVKPSPDGPQSQLYNLREDIGESQNLAASNPDRVKRMQAILQATKQLP